MTILVLHQAVPPTFYNKIVPMIVGNFDEIITRCGLIVFMLQPKLRERKETNNS